MHLISESYISECCSGKQKTSGGWRWMYYKDHIEPNPNEKLSLIHENSEFHLLKEFTLAFCPKEEGKEYVNHIDGDPTNNNASNLEWCSTKRKYATCCTSSAS
ncbi:HNH endonuclease [Rhizophagus clarus]|uniref:HNH endonuclease n=1 Tax=Rhizophagus clarus TaxID=94130 RepID=A0A8H3KPD5_9GLOM|nr:HNH endonuclease [Rhizophagus clarus]